MNNKLSLKWLGQSGFILSCEDTVIACDLYLSDFCQKISKLDHTRLMPIPVSPEKLDNIDHYLITHSHIDHFDPETVEPILSSNAQTKCWCPPSCSETIDNYFENDKSRFSQINSGKVYELGKGIKLIAIPAAHEELEKDENDEYVCFSYLILFTEQKKAVMFGGDTMPYTDHDKIIKKHIPEDYSLSMVLPINGRDKRRADLRFKGNLTDVEAIALANRCNADSLIPCHYGMFALNDIPEDVEPKLFKNFNGQIQIPELNRETSL